MEHLWSFPEQFYFTQYKLLRMIDKYLGQYDGRSDEIVVHDVGGPFADYEGTCE